MLETRRTGDPQELVDALIEPLSDLIPDLKLVAGVTCTCAQQPQLFLAGWLVS